MINTCFLYLAGFSECTVANLRLESYSNTV